MRAQIINTSCSRRGLEIEQLKSFLRTNGYILARDDWQVDQTADLILLSTCGFTEAAEDFGFQTLNMVREKQKPGAKVILGGCIPEINPHRVAVEFNGPVFSPCTYGRLDEIIGAKIKFSEIKRPNTFVNGAGLVKDLNSAFRILNSFDGSLSGLTYTSRRFSRAIQNRLIERRYANLSGNKTFYIQVQEGCSMKCSYCVICKAIGRLRSQAVGAIIEEFNTGLDLGYRRFQLMGDNAGSYGFDIGTNMGELLDEILRIDADYVLDITDINPVYLSLIYEQIMELSENGKLASLYVPVQSGSRRILKLMNRDCDLGFVKEMLVSIRGTSKNGFKLGTSLIVGFPSETDDDLQATIDLCRQVNFDWVWCHSFSARPETIAAKLPDEITSEEILDRARKVKSELKGESLVTIAEDTAGNRTCQG